MPKIIEPHSITSNIIRVFIPDSSQTDGRGLTGLSHTSSGLIISTITNNEASATAYTQAGSTIESITTLGTYEAPTATKCRFKEIDSTNHPGLYEIHLANARFSISSAKSLIGHIHGATNCAPTLFEVQLTAIDFTDAVRCGLSALPNASAGANGGLPTVDANNKIAGIIAAGIDDIHDEVMEGTITMRQAIKLFLAVLTGKSSGGGTSQGTFRDTADTKDRLIVTMDANGNRTSIDTRDGS